MVGLSGSLALSLADFLSAPLWLYLGMKNSPISRVRLHFFNF